MTTKDFSDLVNDLMDMMDAGEKRFLERERLVRQPSLKAHLSLFASQQADESERLRELVVELRGTPHSGVSGVLQSDSIFSAAIGSGSDDAGLVNSCITEQAEAVRRLKDALASDGLSRPARSLFTYCLDAAAARHRSLTSAVPGLSDQPASAHHAHSQDQSAQSTRSCHE
jgi:hypothetical protein